MRASCRERPRSYRAATRKSVHVTMTSTTWSFSQLEAMADTGSSANPTLVGVGDGSVLDPMGLAHQVIEENTDGTPDTIVFNSGYGALSITLDGFCAAGHSLAQGHVTRQASAIRAVDRVRPQGREVAAARLDG